ncbi:unnamed protein product [Adineta steineri]|uniref:Uncharacterized protein n=1 Tax=Adineta steineri TaxID=433720 RepID=A0A815S6B8_9BILA|nr:unnamed protein product [Adineta steineri]CAF3646437.1 unnamed protein product [Adineta steineri]CAF4087243.1 unnamed protein product [Adineta steineri]
MISSLPRQFCPLSYTLNKDLIQAKLMGGINDAIHWWTSALYETIDIYISKNFFIGKEQNLMNAIALIHPHRINMMLPFRTSCDLSNKTSTIIYREANIAETDGLHFALKYASCHIYFLEPLLSF